MTTTLTKKEKLKIEKEKYVNSLYKSAFQYEEDVKNGNIIACQWIHKAIDRRRGIYDEKYDFREDKVKEVFEFFFYIRITIGGKPSDFIPFSWMCWIVMNVYGYYRSKRSDKRVFRYVTIWVGRKSSKTTFAAILSLYAMMKEERNAEVYFGATTKDQASQALRYLKQIVLDSPALRKRVRRLQYKLVFSNNEFGECVARPVANEPDKLDGLNPSFAIIDERHALPDNDLVNIFKTGMMARENPMIYSISTAGFNRDYPFYREIEIAKKVLSGDAEDDSTFYALFTLDDEEKEIDNPDMWIKSNPSLKDKNGIGTIWLDDLVVDYKKACLNIADKKNFIVKNLNCYVDGEDTWIPDEYYKKCGLDSDIFKYIGREDKVKAYLGFDLSNSKDLSSLVGIIEDPDSGKITVFPEFYFPSRQGDKKVRNTGIDLSEWIDKGYIIEHDGPTISTDLVFSRIKWWVENFDVQGIGYDPWNSVELVAKIDANMYVDLKPCKQNPGFYNFPMKYFENLIYEERINVSRNPVLRWNVRNVVVYIDGNANIKPIKNKSLDSIDGVMAMIMALGIYSEVNFDAIAELFSTLRLD